MIIVIYHSVYFFSMMGTFEILFSNIPVVTYRYPTVSSVEHKLLFAHKCSLRGTFPPLSFFPDSDTHYSIHHFHNTNCLTSTYKCKYMTSVLLYLLHLTQCSQFHSCYSKWRNFIIVWLTDIPLCVYTTLS